MVENKKCKNCGGVLLFNPKKQAMFCSYCRSERPILEETDQQIDSQSKNLDVYSCPSCGAKIVCDVNTTSTFCVYCKNTAILKGKLQGKFHPQAIIPFNSTKDEAIKAFTELKKGKKLIPDAFLDPKNIEEIRGIYIPFWFFDFDISAHLTANAFKKSYQHSYYTTTEITEEYFINRKGNISYDNIPIDGSLHFQDDIMRSIEPFDYKDLKKYSSDYLSGFLSELYDVKNEDAFLIAYKRAEQSTRDLFISSINENRYNKIKQGEFKYKVNQTTTSYVLLPVWMLNVKYKDEFYTFAMNGQTKKMIGNIPVDNKKALKYFFFCLLLSIGISVIIAVIIWKLVW